MLLLTYSQYGLALFPSKMDRTHLFKSLMLQEVEVLFYPSFILTTMKGNIEVYIGCLGRRLFYEITGCALYLALDIQEWNHEHILKISRVVVEPVITLPLAQLVFWSLHFPMLEGSK